MLAALIAIPILVFAAPVAPPAWSCQQKGGVLQEYCCPLRGVYQNDLFPRCYVIQGVDGSSTAIAAEPITTNYPYPKECGERGLDHGTYFSLCKLGDRYDHA
jgi:hypothetical protein